MEMCDRIRMAREAKGLSQQEVSEKLNVSRQAVSSWETGATRPDISKLSDLAQVLGTTLEYLLGDEHEETIENSASAKDKAPQSINGMISNENIKSLDSMLQRYFWGLVLVLFAMGLVFESELYRPAREEPLFWILVPIVAAFEVWACNFSVKKKEPKKK